MRFAKLKCTASLWVLCYDYTKIVLSIHKVEITDSNIDLSTMGNLDKSSLYYRSIYWTFYLCALETHCRKTEVIMEKIINVANSEGKKRVYKVPLECNGEDGIRLSCKKNSNEYRTLDVCLMEVCYLNKLWTRGFWRIWQHKNMA